MSEKEMGKEKLKTLVANFDEILRSGKEKNFSEADVSSKFILPFLDMLGWDISSIDEVREQRRTLSGPADYILIVNGKPKLVLELKKFTENLDGYRVIRGRKETFPEQAMRYAWHLKVEWVILTNFREVRLYNSFYRKPLDGLRLKIRYNQFLRDFEKLWILSRDSVESGELDKIERKAERKNVDEAVLEALLRIRQLLSENIRSKNSSMTVADIRENVQMIMDRLLVVRVAEDRGMIGFESLYKELDSWKSRGLPTPFMRSLKSVFRDFDEIYNTKLFAHHPCEDLSIDNEILETVFDILYEYNFDLISADVLGAIYEDYIGHTLEEATSGGVQISQSMRARKRIGIYYTPTHLVEYVVRNTLGELLKKCKSPEEVSRIKVLDPACGSGSFLIKAFDIIKEWYDDYNQKIITEANKQSSLKGYLETVADVNRKILAENLFGVDIDPQAAEIASVNLMLKAIKRGEKLPPIMSQNIMIGNSLVNGKEEGYDGLSDDSKQGLRPFLWEKKFKNIFSEGGFDVVVGNPPYFKVRRSNPIRISQSFEAIKSGPVNAAMMFIDRAINLTKPGGRVGLVLPKMLTYTKGWNGSRKKVFGNTITSVIDCQEAFEGVLLEQILLTLEKTCPEDSHAYDAGEAKGTTIEVTTTKIHQKMAKKNDFIFLEPQHIAYDIRKKMLSKTTKLGKTCNIILGLGIQSLPCWRETPCEKDLMILRGDDVQMWHIRGGMYFAPDEPALQQFKENIAQLNVPHIVTQRIVAHIRYPRPHIILMAAYTEGAFAFNTVVNMFVNDPDYDYRYILGLLNSKLFSYYAYKFVYNNAMRSMDFYEDYAKRLPVKPLPMSEQKEIITVVEGIIRHFKEPSRKTPEYSKYLTESVVDYRAFRDYYKQLDPENRDPKDVSTEGDIKSLSVTEEGDWLVFTVDYVDQASRKMMENHELLRCRFQNRAVRTFLLNEINTKGPSRRGLRLIDNIFNSRIPTFNKKLAKDEQLINKQLSKYLRDLDAHKAWEQKYKLLDDELNKKIYKIYGLDEKEIKHLEENSRPTGWHAD